ncbi:MAG: response regulator [Nitrospirota bacterium]|jgi:CheY-like chemotaxis protein
MNDLGRKTILVVDDSAMMRMFISVTLRKALTDVTITEAENGADAIKKLEGQNFDLILTDMMMPEMNGAQLIENIRKVMNRDMPIIVVTTKGEEKDRELGLSLGANGYITKPVNGHNLREVVIKFLR